MAGATVAAQPQEGSFSSFELRIRDELRLMAGRTLECRVLTLQRIPGHGVVEGRGIEMDYLELSPVMFAVAARAILTSDLRVCMIPAVFIEEGLYLLVTREAFEVFHSLAEYMAPRAVADAAELCVGGSKWPRRYLCASACCHNQIHCCDKQVFRNSFPFSRHVLGWLLRAWQLRLYRSSAETLSGGCLLRKCRPDRWRL